MKTVAILQSNYLPWRGYFDIIRRCDVFIIFDVVQFTKNDWRNRNLVKTPMGRRWLTIPVVHAFGAGTSIDRCVVADARWSERHIRTLQANYARASGFAEMAPWLFSLLRRLEGEANLSLINGTLLRAIAERLDFRTELRSCLDLMPREEILGLDRTERLVALCRAAGAARYLSGPAAKSYLDEEAFSRASIDLSWMSYDGYAPYSQLWGDYDPGLSIVDLLLNAGAEARRFFPG